MAIADVEMTGARYGPVLLIGVWEDKHEEPIYLITSLTDADVAAEHYRLRFRIEPMFATHKSRGFHIHKSHLSRPERLARLVIATSLAYLWVHVAALFAQDHEWLEQFHRKDRCDLSLFQIGVRAIRYALREGKRVPVGFLLPADPLAAPQEANIVSVR
ncbi:MAG: transposase [Roseiflexaceae bacterium]